ncbi:TadE family protein [Actimicrobium antarcticum]
MIPTTISVPIQTVCKQQGSAVIEFTVIGPLLVMMGLSILQYGLLYFAKNQYNHASFMAARAGSVTNASLTSIEQAYAAALVPIYGGGTNPAMLQAAFARALSDVQANARIDILNPTSESFTDFNSPILQARYGLQGGRHVIPNSGQAFKPASIVMPQSGQNIQDANLLKLRITMGYRPQVPLVGQIYTRYLRWLDNGADPAASALIKAGRIPVVTHVTLQMQSDAIEGSSFSTSGPIHGVPPTDPGNPRSPAGPAPDCGSAFCTEPASPSASEPPLEPPCF